MQFFTLRLEEWMIAVAALQLSHRLRMMFCVCLCCSFGVSSISTVRVALFCLFAFFYNVPLSATVWKHSAYGFHGNSTPARLCWWGLRQSIGGDSVSTNRARDARGLLCQIWPWLQRDVAWCEHPSRYVGGLQRNCGCIGELLYYLTPCPEQLSL